MRVRIEKDDLQQGLKIASLALSKEQGNVMSAVRFETSFNELSESQELVLITTDGMFAARVPMSPTFLQGNTPFAVEGKRLVGWLSNVDDGEVTIDVQDDGVQVSCEGATAFFASFDAAALKDVFNVKEKAEVLVSGPSAPFVSGFQFVRAAIGKETSNNEAANQYQVAEFRGDSFFASDTHVISIYNLSEAEGFNLGENVVIKVGKAELPKLVKFLELASADSFRCEATTSFYYLHADDGSCFGFAIPQYKPREVVGLSSKIQEPDVWEWEPQDVLRALGALDASRATNDTTLNIDLPQLEEGGEGDAVFSVMDVTDKKTCTFDVRMKRIKSGEGAPTRLKVHVDWLRTGIQRFPKDSVQVGIQAGRTSYLKLYQRDEALACDRATLMAFRR